MIKNNKNFGQTSLILLLILLNLLMLLNLKYILLLSKKHWFDLKDKINYYYYYYHY